MDVDREPWPPGWRMENEQSRDNVVPLRAESGTGALARRPAARRAPGGGRNRRNAILELIAGSVAKTIMDDVPCDVLVIQQMSDVRERTDSGDQPTETADSPP